MRNHFPTAPRQDTVDVYVLLNGELYTLTWGRKTPLWLLDSMRQTITDCGGEYLGAL